MKKITTTILFLTLSIISFAQANGVKLINNPLYYTPTYTGINGATNFLVERFPFTSPVKLDCSLGYMMKNGLLINAQFDFGILTKRSTGGSISLGYRLSKDNTTTPPLIMHFL